MLIRRLLIRRRSQLFEKVLMWLGERVPLSSFISVFNFFKIIFGRVRLYLGFHLYASLSTMENALLLGMVKDDVYGLIFSPT